MTTIVRRREFITLLGGAAATWPFEARAQQPAMPVIGFLGADAASWSSFTAAFVQRLHELGWIEGRSITIDYEWAEGRPDRIADIASRFVRSKVDVIVTNGNSVATVKKETSVIPIVFAISKDPIGDGFVSNLARPGENVTGLSTQSSDTSSKRLELFRRVLPQLRRLAVMGHVSFKDTAHEVDEVVAAARSQGIETVTLEIRKAEDIAPAFDALNTRADALYVVTDELIGDHRVRLILLALGAKLPTIFNTRIYVQSGGLMSYGPDFSDLFRGAAEYVDKILRGTKPGDIPVQQPTKFNLAINLTAAKVLGLTIPPTVLAIADEVIE